MVHTCLVDYPTVASLRRVARDLQYIISFDIFCHPTPQVNEGNDLQMVVDILNAV